MSLPLKLGQVLRGDRMAESDYDIKFKGAWLRPEEGTGKHGARAARLPHMQPQAGAMQGAHGVLVDASLLSFYRRPGRQTAARAACLASRLRNRDRASPGS